MRRGLAIKLSFLSLLAGSAWGAWTTETIPTSIDVLYFQQYILYQHPGSEFASAYRAIYDVNGVKTGENIALAYRSGKLRIDTKSGASWSTMTFADSGRYPSVALDARGRAHMSFYNSSDKKIYYAHPVPPGAGNCGAQLSYACEQVPGNLWGNPVGRSAIAIIGSNVHIIYEAPYQSGLQQVFYYTKPINSPAWAGPSQAGGGYGITDLALRADGNGDLHMLIVDGETTQWYKLNGAAWTTVGPVVGSGAMAVTAAGQPRLCYRDPATNQLVYASSNGVTGYAPTTIDYDSGAFGVCDIAVPGPNGIQLLGYYNPRIAYFDSPSNAIKYATPPIAAIGGTPWSVNTVASLTGVKRVALSLDKAAKAIIIYYDSAARTFRLARQQ